MLIWGTILRARKGDTRSLDNSSCERLGGGKAGIPLAEISTSQEAGNHLAFSTLGLYRDTGKERGNDYLGLRV